MYVSISLMTGYGRRLERRGLRRPLSMRSPSIVNMVSIGTAIATKETLAKALKVRWLKLSKRNQNEARYKDGVEATSPNLPILSPQKSNMTPVRTRDCAFQTRLISFTSTSVPELPLKLLITLRPRSPLMCLGHRWLRSQNSTTPHTQ